MSNKYNIETIVNELLRLIPISFIMSNEFKTACAKSCYQVHWNYAFSGLHHLVILDARTDEQKCRENFRAFCDVVYTNGNEVFYQFIVFVLTQYYRFSSVKFDLKLLRNAMRDIGISNFIELNQFAEDYAICNIIENKVLDWEEVKEDIIKLEKECYRAEDIIDYQNIGNVCRVLLMKVAKLVYDPIEYGALREDDKNIGKDDTMAMLSNYFSTKLPGKKNETFRAYAQKVKALTNELTHKSTAKKEDMRLAVSATIHLIYMIGIIEGKY